MLVEAIGSIGWSTFLHSLVQGGIAGLLGNSVVAVAFHPLVMVVGVVLGLMGYSLCRWWHHVERSSSFVRVAIDVASRRV